MSFGYMGIRIMDRFDVFSERVGICVAFSIVGEFIYVRFLLSEG